MGVGVGGGVGWGIFVFIGCITQMHLHRPNSIVWAFIHFLILLLSQITPTRLMNTLSAKRQKPEGRRRRIRRRRGEAKYLMLPVVAARRRIHPPQQSFGQRQKDLLKYNETCFIGAANGPLPG